jgi:hypothetical protein
LCDLDGATPSSIDGKSVGTRSHESSTLIHIAA